MVSGEGKAGLGMDGVIAAAFRSERGTASDTIRHVHTAVLDATAVCLADSDD